MAAPRAIDFWFDFSSPYAYIASEWIEAAAARHGRTVNWHAILLGVTFAAAELKSPVAHPIKREYALRDFERSARFAGVPLRLPERFPIATQNAARLFWWLHAKNATTSAHWAHHGLRAVFARGLDLSVPARLSEVAAEFGLDASEVADVCGDPRWKDRLRQANDDAIAAGVFGAPFFVVDGEPFWGNDRRPQIERWLEKGRF